MKTVFLSPAAICLTLACPLAAMAAEIVKPSTFDSASREIQPDVPRGTLSTEVFADSEFFPGTSREYSVYVPAQYRPDQPANLMVFMDGRTYLRSKGPFRTPVVFDNLIDQGVIPVTIAVFINPGV